MSLKARLSLLIIGLVALAVLALTALELNSLGSAWLQHAAERSQTTAQVIKKYVQERTSDIPLPSPTPPVDEIQQIWTRALGQDVALREMMATALAQTRSIVEIAISNESGRIIASTNPTRVGAEMLPRLTLRSIQELGPLQRFEAIAGGRIDYESRVGLGLPGQVKPMFTIQVLTSSLLLREAIIPEMLRTLPISLLALFVSVFLAWWAARLALRPLARIGETIDRISSGQSEPDPEPAAAPSAEFAVVEQKLRMLGEQFRGAQQSRSQLRGSVEQILERLEDVIFLTDASGHVVLCGQPAERLLGLPRDQILGRTLAELFPTGTAAGNTIQMAVADRRAFEEKPISWGNSDDPTHMLLSSDFLPDGGTVLRLRDLGGRQMLESQLNLAQRLTAINRLTGGVAHEIKNPLNSIAIRLELLRNQVLPEMPAVESELNVIAQEITRLDRVVRTFLDFTRPVDLNTVELDLVSLTDGVLTLVRPEAERAGIQIDFKPRIAPVRVRGDADLLKQALLNVVRNGIDAMPQGGRLTLTLVQGPREAVLAIADTGPGIPLENRDKVFQLYYSTKEGGSGIGLAMTYRAFQLHGGSIEVDSSPEGGALVRLRLPAHRLSGGTA
jgi:signal transduction histidine kinase